MVQIGNLHIGKAESVNPPSISIQEASYLWDFLAGRYKCLEETKIYLSLSKDPDFKSLLHTGIELILERQAKTIEDEMIKYKIPLPNPSARSFIYLENIGIELPDEFMFQQIFEGFQSYIDYLGRASRSMITNESL